MNPAICPYCGRNGEPHHRGLNGFTKHSEAGFRAPAARAKLDQVMNWITGVVLITAAVASVAFHARPL